jgi:hypothetical protein
VSAGTIGSGADRTSADRETVVEFDVETLAVAMRPTGADARSMVACIAALSCGVNCGMKLARESPLMIADTSALLVILFQEEDDAAQFAQAL